MKTMLTSAVLVAVLVVLLTESHVVTEEPLVVTCPVSARFPWMLSELHLTDVWMNYNEPEVSCCAVEHPGVVIDFDRECHMCYGRTHSTPSFMWNPNDCQKFFMCVPTGNGGFVAHEMTCPDCMFWNDFKLSCVEVDTSCRVSASVPTGTPNPTFTHDPLISCIDFEDERNLATNGISVLNNGVHVVNNGVDGVPAHFCPEGHGCGFFNASQLEIPYFTHNYNRHRNLRITFKMYPTTLVGDFPEGIISNDCYDHISGSEGNSLFYSVFNGETQAGIKDVYEAYNVYADYTPNQWHDVEIELTETEFKVTISSDTKSRELHLPFAGIAESYCPLVVGSLIKEASLSYFHGYLDQICFYTD